jgi:hypothetical protein
MHLGSQFVELESFAYFPIYYCCQLVKKLASPAAVAHLPHHPKVRGLSPTTVASMGRENGKKLKLFNQFL